MERKPLKSKTLTVKDYFGKEHKVKLTTGNYLDDGACCSASMPGFVFSRRDVPGRETEEDGPVYCATRQCSFPLVIGAESRQDALAIALGNIEKRGATEFLAACYGGQHIVRNN